MRIHPVLRAGLLLAVSVCAAFADDHYILRLRDSSGIGPLARRHGLIVEKSFTGSAHGIFVVRVPSGPLSNAILRSLADDPGIGAVEADSQVMLPELAGVPVRPDGSASLPPLYGPNQTIKFFGASVWEPYVLQPATIRMGVKAAQQRDTGDGVVVALIDTGVDPNNVVLRDVLTSGYDFIHNVPGGSEMVDVNQSTTEVLDQSTTEVLDFASSDTVSLNQSTTEVLDQSTTEVLDQYPPPTAFGHGTMTAGLVHVVAPAALIMPLKAFSGDGTASVSAVVESVYYAIDNGANVISMSFSATEGSSALKKAMDFAFQSGVVLVAAVGNAGLQTNQVFPATYPHVIGVASVDNQNDRSSFTNYGNGLVFVAAPGEGVISTYPGTNNYAAGWGTSFSAPLVAGGAALLVEQGEDPSPQAISKALSGGATPVGQGLGAGVVSLPTSISLVKGDQ